LLDVLENTTEETPDSGLLAESLRSEIERVLSTLTERERDVITLYFGIGGLEAHSLEDIAHRFNLTMERVRQIKENGLRRLRNASKNKSLKLFLG
jgi:RNA polymerase primary sigma factor